MTTRNKPASMGRDIDVSVFNEDEAVDFLVKRTGSAESEGDAHKLAQRLGYCPLALEQAAAYIKDRITYIEYLELLDEGGLKVLEEVDGVVDYSIPVAATFEISLKKIEEEASRQMLYLCAYLASENIEPSLFIDNAEVLPSPLREKAVDSLGFNKVIRPLINYSLLSREGRGYSMHRLLQEVIREKLQDEPDYRQYCLNLFYEAYGFDYGCIDQFMNYTSHVEALLGTVDVGSEDKENQGSISLLYCTGAHGIYCLGDYPRALEWGQKCLAICERLLGKGNSGTAGIYDSIGLTYYAQGDCPRALEWYQKSLAIREALDKDSPDTAVSYNNIGEAYFAQGDYPRAFEWYQKSLAICERVLGKDSPITAVVYDNIGGIYHVQGDYQKALERLQESLDIHERVYDFQGDYQKALEWLQKSLDIRERVLGKGDPGTAMTYNNIGAVYDSQGDCLKALEWFRKSYRILRRVLGDEHPDTSFVKDNMKAAYQEAGLVGSFEQWLRENCG